MLQLTNVTDAAGLSTRLYYDYADPGNAAWWWTFITRVVDPFGRTSYLQHDLDSGSPNRGALTNITDVMGLSSGFAYGPQTYDPIVSLTTPYGTIT